MNYQTGLHLANQIIIDGLGLVLVALFAVEVTAKVSAYTWREVNKSLEDAKKRD